MKKAKDLQPGDRFVLNGVKLTVEQAFDDGRGKVLIECQPIPTKERDKLFGYPRIDNSCKKFLETPLMRQFTQSLLDDLKEEREAKK